MTDLAASVLAGALRHRYTLERELGRGGMATVYLALDLKHDRPVALKVLHRELAASVGPDRFLREIQFMARLTHPHILPLLDSGEAAGLLYYTMPYVEGESLRARLVRDGRLQLQDALRITQEIADALDYAHRHEVVHRDIKPENILLEERHAVIADFGIARAISLAEGVRATTAGLILGTPAYMSPEQALGESDLDGRSDVYSLACVLFEMLVGDPPFLGSTAQATLARRYAEQAPRLQAVRTDVPDAVDEAVSRALARMPSDRFSSASEFAEALKSPETRAPTFAIGRGTVNRGGQRRLLAGLAVVLSLAGAAFLGIRLANRQEPPGPASKRVAVAVFANRTGDPSLESLGIMAADWIIQGLTRTGLVDVVDLGTVLVQSRKPGGELIEPRELARQNGAHLVVWGNYYGSSDSLIVQSSVIDVENGTVLQASAPVQVASIAPTTALEALQDRVIGAMATVLDPSFASWTSKSSKAPNYEAYRSYIAGQSAYWNGSPAAESRRLFQEAVVQDPTFLTAAVWLAFIGANGGGCSLTDSVATALAQERTKLPTFDRLTLDLSVARCRNDWSEGFRLATEQAALKPRSTYAVYTGGFFAITSGHPRVARDFLRTIDPARDLGWVTDPAKTVYWRDYLAAEHLLGEYRSELRHAERQLRDYPGRLTTQLFAIRALAGLGRGSEALNRVGQAMRLPDDSIARVQGGMTPGHFAYVAATELKVHGDSAAAGAAAQRAVDWYQADPAPRLAGGRYERHYLARALLLLGRVDEAVAAMAQSADTTDVLSLTLRGVLSARQGRDEQAREVDRRLATMDALASRPMMEVNRARLKLALGQRDSAFALVTRAGAEGRVVRSMLSNDIHSDPLLDGLRGDERFERVNRGDR